MCGIFGLKNWGSSPLDRGLVVRAVESLRHRGPDDEGYLLSDTTRGRAIACGGEDTVAGLELPRIGSLRGESFDFALGFRRLAIVDLSPAGHQPMRAENGRFWVVFNGEIYNHVELRSELQQMGHTFRSHSDTEVLLAAFATWGPAMLPRLVGMFAFAILDTVSRRLFLARDPFGIKPLYYVSTSGGFSFASEIKALLVLPDVTRRANPERVFEYLSLGMTDHGGETCFQDVKQLPAAHFLAIDLAAPGRIEPQRYWESSETAFDGESFSEAAGRLRELFLESVNLHLRSNVPVGCCVSGGIDSSAIVMAMRQLCGTALDLHAFTFVSEDPLTSEERFADLVGEEASVVVHKTRVSAEDLVADLERLVAIQEEPFGSTSIYAQHRVFREAHRAGIKVMLDGQGADEMLAGYGSFLAPRVASLLRAGHLLQAHRVGAAATRFTGLSSRAVLRSAIGLAMPAALRGPLRRLRGQARSASWLNREWFTARGVATEPRPASAVGTALPEFLLDSLVRSSLPMLLRYEDRNSMAHSVESRVPFVMPSLADFLLSLPESYLISGDGTSKAVFRRAMRGLVPDPVLDRREKVGFATPQAQWLSNLTPWIGEVLNLRGGQGLPCLVPEAVAAIRSGVVARREVADSALWRLINLVIWVRQFRVEL